MTIKITALRKAFYNGEIIKPGQVITFNGDTVPSWAKKADTPVKKAEVPAKKTKAPAEKAEAPAEKADELAGKTEEELNTILDELITKGVELNVYLENTDNKTVIEQINELTAAINKAANKGE